jgi:hypothetical protein
MWHSIFRLWRARRGRRAAVAAVAPLVERSRYRLHEIPDFVWCDPYMVGFIVTLITFVAKREVRRLDSQGLGLVQLEAWAAITGVESDLIGEEILQLSITEHQHFNEGCRNAITFGRALYDASGGDAIDQLHRWGAGTEDMLSGIGDDATPPEAHDGESVVALWADYFDAHVAAPMPIQALH